MTGAPAEVLDLESFRFRGLHPLVHLGTASDRYAGWLGQIYSPERFAARVTRRSKTIAGRSFVEEVLPVACVAEYFEHFPVLELDYTFYGPLLDTAGRPTGTLRTLAAYRRHLPGGARLLLKAPQAVSAQKLRRGGSFVPNPGYLDAQLFTDRFLQPAAELLGEALAGVILEQEYQRKAERILPERLAEDWDRFFASVPADGRFHLELRTESYLAPAVFAVLEKHGVGQVLSHWTWLPPLEHQFELGGRRFLNRGGEAVVRLMTPRGVRYEDAYAAAHPFDRLVPGMLDPGMLAGAAGLMHEAAGKGRRLNVIVNNRAGGNAPLIARALARRFLGLEEA
ncbi:MAG: DUF72 domain-containing protein [Deferrisomatales bacterium]|nr:DUF72 domain-containing protein [Deferrisomatales bacterium]